MIAGVGLDVCEISRMEKLISDGRFLARFFSAEEQAYIQGKGKSGAQSMAGIFAAKEALGKALGVGIAADLKEISVLHDAQGAPYYSLSGEYARLAEDRRISSFYLSITHEAGIAAAVCVAERNG
ncbi:MAG: holo-ACP synthase [Clostridia bacterium]|nr:holo-ACP synthase [Clostridia bacterium]